MHRPHAVIDHLVVVAPDLASGAASVAASLGVEPMPGGQHEAMGTHNLVLRTGPTTYLEVISVDPSAAAPSRPRWFGMDVPAAEPALRTWVARTDDVDASLSGWADLLGEPLALSRGDLSWRVTVRPDGRTALDGALPPLITWDGEPAAARMPDRGVHLVSLTIFHPNADELRQQLGELGLVGAVTVQPDFGASLAACFDTPSGPATLGHLGMTAERAVAIELFNRTWTYLEVVDPDPVLQDALVATAEASLWHWRRVGTAHEWAVGEWMCSRVQASIGHGQRSLEHAQRCLDLCLRERVEDFVPASAHEALSRAYAVLGDMEAAKAERNAAYRIAVDLDEDDRLIIEQDLSTLPIPKEW